MKNRYIKHTHISENKFRQVLRLFCADLTSTQNFIAIFDRTFFPTVVRVAEKTLTIQYIIRKPLISSILSSKQSSKSIISAHNMPQFSRVLPAIIACTYSLFQCILHSSSNLLFNINLFD